jgi:hypothetical protein
MKTVFILISLVYLTCCCEIDFYQYDSLVKFYNETGGYQWKNNNWFESSNYCQFTGISCRTFSDTCQIVSITLDDMGLSGNLSNMNNFTSLLQLRLSNNHRLVNNDVLKFNNLIELNLSNTNVGGILIIDKYLLILDVSNANFETINIPKNSQMNYVFARNNKLTSLGTPSFLNLFQIDISNNYLNNDNFDIDLLTNVSMVDISRNQFTYLARFFEIIVLDASHNKLKILGNIYGMYNLRYLDISYNNISANLNSISAKYPYELSYLNIRSNNFTGSIESINQPGLVLLDARDNQLDKISVSNRIRIDYSVTAYNKPTYLVYINDFNYPFRLFV